MLPAKYQPNPPGCSREEVFEWFLLYMGMAAILNFELRPFYLNLV